MAERAYTPYALTARILHWLTAAMVLTMLPAGIIMANIADGPLKDLLFHYHRSLGVLIIPVVVVRLIYRLTHRPPPLPADIPAIQQLGAEALHLALYGLLIIQPLVGWVATSAYPAPILVAGLFELPPIWPPDRAFSDLAFAVHRGIGIVIAVLLIGHIGAALHHHFGRRDGVLMRMVG
jgi:cytochrome b561